MKKCLHYFSPLQIDLGEKNPQKIEKMEIGNLEEERQINRER